jgi:ChpA-C
MDRYEEDLIMNVKKIAALATATSALVLSGASAAMADTAADGFTKNNDGFLSGNLLQIPIDKLAVNFCNNAIAIADFGKDHRGEGPQGEEHKPSTEFSAPLNDNKCENN